MASSHIILTTLAIMSLLLMRPAFSKRTCQSQVFSEGRTFDYCRDLPYHGATLHWTYDLTTYSLSTAYTSIAGSDDNWVAWGFNPKDSGMVGAQVIMAFKAPIGGLKATAYNLISYDTFTEGGNSYNVSRQSTEEQDGKITIFSTWSMGPEPNDETLMVNLVWQVGHVDNGLPGMHQLEKANTDAKMRFFLLDTRYTMDSNFASALSPEYDAFAEAPTAANVSNAAVVIRKLGLAILLAPIATVLFFM